MRHSHKIHQGKIVEDGLDRKLTNPNLSSIKCHNYSNSYYIYHGPQIRTVQESITTSTNATFLVYQCPTSLIHVKQPVLPSTIEPVCPYLSQTKTKR
ncbi:unnamed protein product [Cochlearia groenlandica]